MYISVNCKSVLNRRTSTHISCSCSVENKKKIRIRLQRDFVICKYFLRRSNFRTTESLQKTTVDSNRLEGARHKKGKMEKIDTDYKLGTVKQLTRHSTKNLKLTQLLSWKRMTNKSPQVILRRTMEESLSYNATPMHEVN